MPHDDTEHTFRHRTSHYATTLERRRHNDDRYDVWSDNDDLDVLPRMTYREAAPSIDDVCAIATTAVAAGLIAGLQAEGVARTLMRSYRAAPTALRDSTPLHFTYRTVRYDNARLRAAAITISAATYGHEDPTILSQTVLAAILEATR